MKGTVEIFTELGARLARFGKDDVSREVIARAIADNEWFSEADICYAVNAIRCDMLSKGDIEQWLAHYPICAPKHKSIALIMAGNIPLVGFFDLMCVIASGNTPYIKYSSKDKALMSHIVELLFDIEPQLAIKEYDDALDYDAVIATGGDSANIYFRNRFKDTPCLLRGSRHSAAVLTGKESEEELQGLSRDIFTYSGLGCRSVSLLFVPKGYQFTLPRVAMCLPYHNNYIQHRALLTMTNQAFEDSGEALFVRSEAQFPTKLSQINIAEYDTIDEVLEWLRRNNEHLQCVVASTKLHGRCVPFGQAQHPELTNYADEKDTMAFLYSI